ncbi:MAG: flagellar hook-basal body complex protein FliE [Sphingobium sp.]|nr:flagellar hook-basal body complex protein FliE [Sphingobium sp.]MBP6111749.1 flagellar hook-basal body complex protein FliE [Sphingobium sp.]MBP8671296.1 flagellar hook-basal body complex protein FliE [Sphingobium sp.]MBP9158353.1 flagellar hook-basal body complex protein FliE [Sphingobium sp.]MCC6482072.1 flagellar hook-basal body complex protein FliE [Sphingomonadaceae bacterium]
MNGISTDSIMAIRSAILQKNAALRDVSAPPGGAQVDGVKGGGIGAPSGSADFTTALKGALEKVNGLQNDASQAASAFERGETTDIAAVMLAKQKASVSFEATLQVRNKLLSAYRDIMSMPV